MVRPPQFVTDQEFETIRRFLDANGFREPDVVAALQVGSLAELIPEPEDRDKVRRALQSVPFPQRLLVYLFVLGGRVPEEIWRQWVPTDVESSLSAAGLVAPDPRQPGCVWCPFCVYPTHGLVLVSDRVAYTDGEKIPVSADFVFAGVSAQSRRFIDGIPETPCEDFLDIGTGCGVAALIAAKGFAKNVWALDITARSVDVAEFNRRLNGLENVQILQGDLFAPVAGLTFDRIVSHPPYLPTLGEGLVFASGGEDGEGIVSRLVEALPGFLRPGGTFYGLALISDRRGKPVEERLRDWMGPDGRAYHVLLFVRETDRVARFISDQICVGAPGFREYAPWKERYDRWEVEALNYTHFVIHCTEGGDGVFSVRRQCGPQTHAAEIEWMLRCQMLARSPNEQWIWDARLRIAPGMKLVKTSQVAEGHLVTERFKAETDYPMEASVEGPEALEIFLEACGEGGTGSDIYRRLREHSVEIAEPTYLELCRHFLADGLIESEALPLPGPTESEGGA